MTEALPFVPENFMPQSAVSNRQYQKTAILGNNNCSGCEVIRHTADGFLNLCQTSGIFLNLLIINNSCLAKFTPERSVYIYIFFKYIYRLL